ncbi:MAG TPA: cysteine desulfurase family protein [Bacteroidia bacterium]|nr:cysteine desulfurase family protein [Bacteroidia bacterium]
MPFIYLDYNATTPVNEVVVQAMLPFFTDNFGNASSATHQAGWYAKQATENARQQVATLIGAQPDEIIFTSGATEAVNIALQGIYHAYKTKGNHIVTVTTEHKAVGDTCRYLETIGANITFVPVNTHGQLDLNALTQAITPNTIAVCVMLANNETGVLQPVKEIAEIVHKYHCLMVTDATQAVGKIPVDVNTLAVDVLVCSAHKMYGPKGCGALYIRRKNPRVHLKPLLFGGGHEKNIRPGTLNVPGIVGMGAAAALAQTNLTAQMQHLNHLLHYFEDALHQLPVQINGNKVPRLPNTSSVTFTDTTATQLYKALPQIGVANGSACTSALQQPSHVLQAMGLTADLAQTTLRFSFGVPTTIQQLNDVICLIKKMYA